MTEVRKRKECRKAPKGKMVCKKCGRERNLIDFFTYKNGERCPFCKECLSAGIDNKKRDTFDWILKEFNVPFIKNLWLDICKRKYQKDPDRFGPRSVIGEYLKIMKTRTYIDYTYDDSDIASEGYNLRQGYTHKRVFRETNNSVLNRDNMTEDEKKILEHLLEDEQEAKKELENDPHLDDTPIDDILQDIIPERELPEDDDPDDLDFMKRLSVEDDGEAKDATGEILEWMPEQEERTSEDRFVSIINQDDMLQREKAISDALTADDIQMLSVKWGSDYRPSEWLRLEEMYRKYTNEFEMNVDREEVLKKMCKTSLKMDQALDEGSIADYTKLQTAFDSLRKSGKFTEAQNKDKQEKYLDSVGELVAMVEKQGGIIPAFDYNYEVMQDKVDFTLKDMQSYTYNLVRNEMGLGNLIETYIQKLDQAAAQNPTQSLETGLVTSREEEEALGDMAAEEWSNRLADSVRAEADAMFADMEG